MADSDTPGVGPAPDRETLLATMHVAARAPSVHNTQPWRWVYRAGQLDLFRDNERRLPSADPQGRQLMVSCGAVLDHARSAFAAAGLHTEVMRLPDHSNGDLLATLTFQPWPHTPPPLRSRAEIIERRRTDRRPLADPGDLSGLVETVRLLARDHDVILDVLDRNTASRLGTASEHSAALRRYDMSYRAELQWWSGHDKLPDGVPADALVSEVDAARVPVGRRFPHPGRATPRDEPDDRQDEAELWILGTPDDSPLSWLRTGEALSAVLLECTAAGLATCPLTHITELPETRRIASDLTASKSTAQVVLRVGRAPDGETGARTPRRPVADFCTIAPDAFGGDTAP
ncbi:Acg family FMN-binding oxidoreductase [Nocardia testacea]|uniref:Acg family FMN-binding oxidoreductase n=1 Tax=Nocardia testacea TaxID=248551 RepID=A0ABW7VRR7_9NOCA